MNLQTAVSSGFQNFTNFKGRASRSEFWWFFLFSQLTQIVLQQISSSIALIAWFVLLIPGLSENVRRLHDSGRSLAWLLWLFASLVGFLVVFSHLLTQTAQTIANFDAEKLLDNSSEFGTFVMFFFMISVTFSGIANCVFLLMPSDSELNKYGPPPPPVLEH